MISTGKLLGLILVLIFMLPACAKTTTVEITLDNIDSELDIVLNRLVSKSRTLEEMINAACCCPDNLVSEILEYIRVNNNSTPDALSFEKKKEMYNRFVNIRILLKKTGIPKETDDARTLYNTVSELVQDVVNDILLVE